MPDFNCTLAVGSLAAAAIIEKSIAEESGGVAGGGRQGTADDREKQFSVRGDHGRLIARGS